MQIDSHFNFDSWEKGQETCADTFHCLYFLKELRGISKLMKKEVNRGPTE